MADEPKPETNTSPAPTDAAASQPGSPKAASDPKNPTPPSEPPKGGPQPDALSDGTVPTILETGAVHKSVAKGNASLTNIYRKADVLTTLFTFGGAVIAALIILGGYAYFTRAKTKAPTVTPKVSTLNQADLNKLNSFFSGNTAGNSSQILTVSSSSLFNGRVAINSDLKVVGGVDVSGTATLANLSVSGTSTLGVTAIRGSLNVAGPVNLQSPAVLSGGATINGNVTASGNGSYGGSLSAGVINAGTISVTTLNISGHLNIAGQVPSVSPNSEAGPGASATVSGNDAAGTVTITTGSSITPSLSNAGQLVQINFQTVYPNTPRVLITAVGATTGALPAYVIPSANNFVIGTASGMAARTTYSWDYWAVQ